MNTIFQDFERSFGQPYALWATPIDTVRAEDLEETVKHEWICPWRIKADLNAVFAIGLAIFLHI